jgi:hypothetical protein
MTIRVKGFWSKVMEPWWQLKKTGFFFFFDDKFTPANKLDSRFSNISAWSSISD